RLQALYKQWDKYIAGGQFEQFIEFALSINSLTAYFTRTHLAGLARLCEGLENLALNKMGDQDSHPLSKEDISSVQRQLITLAGSIETSRTPVQDRRVEQPSQSLDDWIKPRSIWMVAAPAQIEAAKAFNYELSFYGFKISEMDWGEGQPDDVP